MPRKVLAVLPGNLEEKAVGKVRPPLRLAALPCESLLNFLAYRFIESEEKLVNDLLNGAPNAAVRVTRLRDDARRGSNDERPAARLPR